MFEYIWKKTSIYLTSTYVLQIATKIREVKWEEGIKYFLWSEETISLMKNLNVTTLDYLLWELSEWNYYDAWVSYLDVLEDEVEELKILLDDWWKG